MFIKDITYTGKSALYIDLSIDIDSKGSSNRTKRNNKRDDFNLQIMNFLF
jgi:hypothetical protein